MNKESLNWMNFKKEEIETNKKIEENLYLRGQNWLMRTWKRQKLYIHNEEMSKKGKKTKEEKKRLNFLLYWGFCLLIWLRTESVHYYTENPESMEWFLEGQAFSRSYDLAPSPPPAFPLSPSASSTGDTQEDWERETTWWRERGRRGWARSRIIRSRENLVVFISESYQNCQKGVVQGYTHETSGFKTSGFKTSGFKTSETSGLQNARDILYLWLVEIRRFCCSMFAGKVMAVFYFLF